MTCLQNLLRLYVARSTVTILAWLVVLLTVTPLSAQDLEKALPPAVPKLVPAQPAESTTTNALPEISHFGAQAGEKVLLKKLVGIKFLGQSNQVVTNGLALTGVDVSQVPLLQSPDFQIVLKPFLNRPASFESLQRLTFATRTYLEATGYPFLTIYLPQQDITGGSVQIVVMTAALDDILKIEGARYFSEKQYRSAITQQPGEPINASQLKEDIDWLNRNPFRNVAVVAEPGGRSGTTALKLRVNERFPIRVYTGYNNTGSKVSDEDRLFAGFNWGNAFGLGHQLGYQFSTSPDFKTSTAHSGNYSIDLPWRHTIRLFGAYSELEGRVAPPLILTGRSWQVGMRYDIPLPRPTPRVTHNFNVGIDFKASDNNLVFATIPVTDNLTHVVQAVAGYDLNIADKWGSTSVGLSLTGSPGNLTDRNNDTFFNTSRTGATSSYVYGDVNLTRQQRLPKGFSWSARAQLQMSSNNLLGSEQFSGAGSGSVRGYEEGEVYGDEALFLSHELALPRFGLMDKLGWKQAGDALQLFGFEDFAILRSVDRLPGERRYTDLHSVGVGLRYQLRQNLTVNFTYGWQLRDSRVSRSGDNSRGHIYMQAGF